MLLDRLSQSLARVRGLPAIVAVGLVIVNYLLQFVEGVPVISVLSATNLLLHLGVVVGLLGVLLAEALGSW
jgi:hypothetical protein